MLDVMLNISHVTPYLILTIFETGIFIILVKQMKKMELKSIKSLSKIIVIKWQIWGRTYICLISKPMCFFFFFKVIAIFSELKAGILQMEITLVSSLLSTQFYFYGEVLKFRLTATPFEIHMGNVYIIFMKYFKKMHLIM